MSKIHEALKKAQEEKPWGLPADNQHDQQEWHVQAATEEVFVAPVFESCQPTRGPSRGGIPGQYLRLEDLLKQCSKPVWRLDPDKVVFSQSHGPSSGAEQFRTLRTRLYQMRDVSPLKTVLVTSAVAGEGKTFVAVNLAQAIACERDRKVLLIDGDLRCATLHLPLAAPLSPGLSEYLRGEASEADIIQHGQEGNFCLIAGGESGNNPSELLSNGRLRRLLDRIAPLFDWVIIDSPPCLPIADASVLAALADGVLLVVRASSTPSALPQKARKELQKRNVIGVVLNAVEQGQFYGKYYYPGDGYSQSGSRGPRK